jgi:hypothetical protein
MTKEACLPHNGWEAGREKEREEGEKGGGPVS